MDFSWIPGDDSQGQRLRSDAKRHFDRHALHQPFKRRGSLPASVERHLGLENLVLMLRDGLNGDKSLNAEQRQAAREELKLTSLRRLLKAGGGAPRGASTQTASADDLRARYFQPNIGAEETRVDESLHSEDAHSKSQDTETDYFLCQRCGGINAENLSGGREYVHSTLARLTRSSLVCRLCRFMLDMMGISTLGLSLARYRVVLTIEERSQFLDIQNRCIAVEDDSLDTRNHLSEMTVMLQDLKPWEQREHDLLEYDDNETQNEVQTLKSNASFESVDSKTLSDKGDTGASVAKQSQYTLGCQKRTEALTFQPKTVRTESGLRCFTEQDDPARGLVSGISWIRQIGTTTASNASFDVAAVWLERCLAEEKLSGTDCATDDHRELDYTPPSSPHLMYPFNDDGSFITDNACSFDESGLSTELPDIREEIPSRLLEINKNATWVRLVETQGQQLSYVALSYCWGKDDGGEWKTTKRTLVNHIVTGLRSDLLPLTLQHSLQITRRLGISYIWIDALCIVQDSSEDWAKEATKMAGVYFGSVLTIAASSARSWSDGCFNQHSKRITERGLYSDCVAAVDSELSTGDVSRLYVLSTDALRFGEHTDTYYHGAWERYHRQLSGIAYSNLVHGSSLATRGWTFQEHQLPRRTLYYTSEQLFWECQHCRCSEDNFPIQQDLRKHPVLATKHLSSDAVAELWYLSTVEDYSHRVLTFSKDKLVAVSALAKSMYLRRPQPYIAGLWKDSIVHGLMWRRSGKGSKDATTRCPTWSWASQNSAIQYLWTKPGVQRAINWLSRYRPRIVNVEYISSPISPFSDVLSATIEIKTILSIGTVVWHTEKRKGGQNSLGDSGWSGHNTIAEAKYEYVDGGYKLVAELEQGLYISSAKTDTIWYFEAAMDASKGSHERVAVAYLGLDNLDTALADGLGPEENNNNLVFLLLSPPNLNVKAYKRVGIARFRSSWVRPNRPAKWRLSDHIKEHPLAGFQEDTVCLL